MTDLHLCDLAAEAYFAADVESNTAQAIIRKVDDYAVIAFRGTWDTNAVLTDAHATASWLFPLGTVHAGFLWSMLSIGSMLREAIGNRKFVCTGHSKGGAEAWLFAAWMAGTQGQVASNVVTFGSPRIAHWSNVGLLRITLSTTPGTHYRHADDPVPMVPPWFSHPRAVTQIGHEWRDARIIEDHYLTAYREALETLTEGEGYGS